MKRPFKNDQYARAQMGVNFPYLIGKNVYFKVHFLFLNTIIKGEVVKIF